MQAMNCMFLSGVRFRSLPAVMTWVRFHFGSDAVVDPVAIYYVLVSKLQTFSCLESRVLIVRLVNALPNVSVTLPLTIGPLQLS